MQVCVLGPVGVRDDVGADVDLGGRLRRLLAALVVANGSVVSVDRLVDTVWEGRPPRSAETTLRSYVTRLRRALGPLGERLVHREPGYVIDVAGDELDSWAFEDDLDRALGHLRTGDPATGRRLLVGALGRWRGSAFAEFDGEDWARPECVRLEERRLEAGEALIDAQLEEGLVDEATAAARALVEAEPLRERPRLLLMRALYAAGRHAEALRVATSYRRYLVEETGLDPSSEVIELEQRIASGEPGLTVRWRALRGYELGERLGEGAFAVVYRAVQPGLEREVAIKVIRAELADQADFIRRFEFEARTIARIEHPNVVPLYDFWREPGAAFIVMRLLPGGSVEQELRTRGAYSVERVIRLLADVGGALEAAHAAGVVHRDVRPANLLLDAEGATYLADFGIALPTATVDDLAVRSPAYAAPEVLRAEATGPTADVLSLAVTTFELLTGRLPFADSLDRGDVVQHQLNDPLPPVSEIRPDLPAGIDDVLLRATAKAPGDRHPTVTSFVDDVCSVLERRGPAEPAPSAAWLRPVRNPYLGLHAFDEGDAHLFFGRESLVAELLDAVEQRPMVTVVGPSGSGKSSVVRAGVLPAIRNGAVPGSEHWFVATMVPGPDPIDAFEVALLRVAANPPASLRTQLTEPGGLLRAVRRVVPDERTRILLVIDQFEELFTLARDGDERDRFLGELAEAITRPDSPIRVIATLRADHFDAPLQHANIAELVTQGTVTVRPMTPDELARAIVRPASANGVDVEPALAGDLVAGVSERPAALPLLQFSLAELFERRVADTMLLATHREMGGLTGALAARADRILEEGGAEDAAEARRIFSRLVTFGDGADDTRRRALRSEFGDRERTARLIDTFVAARLLSTDRDPTTRAPTVEVAHEALLRDWPRLRRWLAEDRELRRSVGTIGAAADAWDRGGRQPADLYRGGRLDAALDTLASDASWLRPLDREFVEASRVEDQAERSRERRRVRRLRRLVAGVAAALVVALVAGAIAVTQQRRADREAEAAARRADEATAASADAELAELVARSAAAAVTRPEQALLLALEAHRRAPTTTTVGAVLDAIAAGSFEGQVRAIERLVDESCLEGNYYRFSPDGRWEFATVGAEAQRQDLVTGMVETRAAAPEPCAQWWEDVDTGRRWASSTSLSTQWTASGEGEWEPSERRRVGGFLHAELVAERLLFGQDAGVAAPVGEVVVVDAATLLPVAAAVPELRFHLADDPLPATAASRATQLFAVGTGDGDGRGLLVVLDAASGHEVFRVQRQSRVTAVAFGQDGTSLVVGTADGTVATVDVDSGGVRDAVAMTEPLEVVALGVRADGVIVAVNRRWIELIDPIGERRGSPIGISLASDAVVRLDGAVVIDPFDDEGSLLVVEPNGGPLVERGWDVAPDSLVGFGDGRAATVTSTGRVDIVDLDTGARTSASLPPQGDEPLQPVAAVPEPDGFLAWDDEQLVRWRNGRIEERVELWSGHGNTSLTRGPRELLGPAIELRQAPVVPGGGFAGAGALVVFEDDSAEGIYRFDPDAAELSVTLRNESPPFTASAAGPAPHGGVHVVLADGAVRTYNHDGERVFQLATGFVQASHTVSDEASGRLAIGGPAGAVVVDPATRGVQAVTDVGGVVGLGFARDGDVLVLVESDGTVRLWDTVRGEMVGVLWVGNGTAPSSPVWYDEAADTVWVATSGRVLEFSLDPQRWIERACALVSRELSADEWDRLVPGDLEQRPVCPRS